MGSGWGGQFGSGWPKGRGAGWASAWRESGWWLPRNGCAASLCRKDGGESVSECVKCPGTGGNEKQNDNKPKKILYICQCKQVGSSNSPPMQMSNPCCFQVNMTLNETCACRPVMAGTLLSESKPSSRLNARRNHNHLVGCNNQTKEPPQNHRSHTGR